MESDSDSTIVLCDGGVLGRDNIYNENEEEEALLDKDTLLFQISFIKINHDQSYILLGSRNGISIYEIDSFAKIYEKTTSFPIKHLDLLYSSCLLSVVSSYSPTEKETQQKRHSPKSISSHNSSEEHDALDFVARLQLEITGNKASPTSPSPQSSPNIPTNNQVILEDISTNSTLHTLTIPPLNGDYVISSHLFPHRLVVLTTSFLYIYDLMTLICFTTISLNGVILHTPICDTAVSAGLLAFATDATGNIALVNVNTTTIVSSYKPFKQAVTHIKFCLSNQAIAVASTLGTVVRILDVNTMALLYLCKRGNLPSTIIDMQWNENMQLLLLVTSKGSVHIFSISLNKKLLKLGNIPQSALDLHKPIQGAVLSVSQGRGEIKNLTAVSQVSSKGGSASLYNRANIVTHLGRKVYPPSKITVLCKNQQLNITIIDKDCKFSVYQCKENQKALILLAEHSITFGTEDTEANEYLNRRLEYGKTLNLL